MIGKRQDREGRIALLESVSEYLDGPGSATNGDGELLPRIEQCLLESARDPDPDGDAEGRAGQARRRRPSLRARPGRAVPCQDGRPAGRQGNGGRPACPVRRSLQPGPRQRGPRPGAPPAEPLRPGVPHTARVQPRSRPPRALLPRRPVRRRPGQGSCPGLRNRRERSCNRRPADAGHCQLPALARAEKERAPRLVPARPGRRRRQVPRRPHRHPVCAKAVPVQPAATRTPPWASSSG